MTTKRLIPLALAGALLSPVFSLGLGASVVDAATCPANRRTIANVSMPAHGSYSTKKYAVLPYSGPGTPELLHYSLGRDSSTPFPNPLTGALSVGNILIGGHNSTRTYYTKKTYEYHEKFLKRWPMPPAPRKGQPKSKARIRWEAEQAKWLRANGLSTAPAASKNPPPFAHIQALQAGQVIKIRSGCWVHSYKVLAGTHETIMPNQATYALRPPRSTKATSVFSLNKKLLTVDLAPSARVANATALATSSRLLTLYGCVEIGNDYAAKRKIVRAVWVSKTWTTAA